MGNNRGSIWRKWDLQVGTRIYNRYKKVELQGDKSNNLSNLTGLSSNQINGDHKDLSNEDYAKLFVEYFVNCNDTNVIALANHNSGEGIEEILNYLKSKKDSNPNSIYTDKFIFPGIEVGGNDKCHILIIFNPETSNNKKSEFSQDGKTILRNLTWKEYIEKFLDDIKIPNPRFDGDKPTNSSSLGARDIIKKSQDWDFVSVFPHITNGSGLWKELQESNKKEIYNDENFGIVDIPSSAENNQDLRTICEGRHSSWGTKGIAVINSSDSESLKCIGTRFSYIKCDPTIEGLRQLFIEPHDRVRTGQEPEIIKQVQLNRTKYLRSIKIGSIQGYNKEHGKWFDNIEIPLNHELVAIIGNKGSGKSALADIIALCSNFKGHNDDFSFLNSKKFNSENGKIAKNFEATIIWESGNSNTKKLADNLDNGSIELVKYLPQGYFERLTNEINSVEEFKKEIEKVVYTHLDDDNKIGVTSFDELINKRKELIHNEINRLKERLAPINQSIFEKEKKLNINYKLNLEAQIKQKNEELEALIEPAEVQNPREDNTIPKTNDEIYSIKKEISSIEEEIKENKNLKRELIVEIREIEDLKYSFESKQKELDSFKKDYIDRLEKFDTKFEDIFKYEFEYKQIDKLLSDKKKQLKKSKILLGEEHNDNDADISLSKKLNDQKESLSDIQKKLDGPERAYQEYLSNKENWEHGRKRIIGDSNTPHSLKFYEQELTYVNENLKKDIEREKNNRFEIVKEIFLKKKSILEIYKSIKEKIDLIITNSAELLEQYKINIDASFNLKYDFQTEFLNYVSLNKTGTFYGKDNAEIQFKKLIKDINWENYEEGIKEFLTKANESFFTDRRNKNSNTFIETQVDEVVGLYNYLFSLEFLDYTYELKQGDKKLEQLSPGEKGALLLIFYLLLDNNDIPLIIDQPEDNLDNNTVANVLVPFIKKAKTKRQIILVTHNPNLAVVADAEQIIYVNLDKKDQNKFSFKSGSIENPTINGCIVKVLEGDMPAFNKRKQKYYN